MVSSFLSSEQQAYFSKRSDKDNNTLRVSV